MAEWKYIMLPLNEQRIPIIFPNALVHAHVAGAMQLVMDTFDKRKDLRGRQLDSLLEGGSHKPVSAGFVNALSCAGVFGSSESLGSLVSQPADVSIINETPYTQGLPAVVPVEKLLLIKTIELLMERVKGL